MFRDLLDRVPSLTSAYLLVSKQKYGVSLTSLKAQLTDWFNDEKQKYFVSRDDLVERARELANELDIDDSAVDHGFVRYLYTDLIRALGTGSDLSHLLEWKLTNQIDRFSKIRFSDWLFSRPCVKKVKQHTNYSF